MTTRGLNKTQKRILGIHFTSDVYHPSYKEFHPMAEEDAFFEDEEEQTFEEFVEMGNREPNAEGTGRFQLTPTRSRIALLFFNNLKKRQQKVYNDFQHQVSNYIRCFLGLEVDIINYDDRKFDQNEGTLHIGDYIYDLDIFPKNQKKKKLKTSSSPPERFVEVFSLFDALESLVVEPYLSMVAFLDCSLCETTGDDDHDDDNNEKDKDGFQIIYGRACGNRIACVSLKDCLTFKDLLCVATHELLHTIGFDHCNSWKCLMNATGSDSWLFLSPVNLRKLKHFKGIPEEDHTFLLERYQTLLDLLKSWNNSLFHPEIRWIEEKIARMKKACQMP